MVKDNGRVYFLDSVLPDELIRFQPGKKRKRKYGGKVGEILEPSKDRVTPECQYFGVCGGCIFQHANPETQIRYKEKILIDNLERIGKASPNNLLKPIQGPIWGYRRKARLGVKLVPNKGGILVGFRERQSSYITAMNDCKTLDSRISNLLPGFQNLISNLSNNNRIPQIEVAAGDNRVALVLRHMEPLSGNDKKLLSDYAKTADLNFYLQSTGPDSVLPLWPASPELLNYALDNINLTLEFSPVEFTQVNSDVNKLMVNQAIELLNPEQGFVV